MHEKTPEPIKIERTSVEKILEELNAEALWTHDLPAIRHATGFTGSAAQLIWRKDDKPLLIVDGRYTLQAKEECPNAEVLTAENRVLEFVVSTLKERKFSRVAFDANSFSYAEWKQVVDTISGAFEFVAYEGRIQALRMVKSDEEIATIRKGIEVADKAIRKVYAELMRAGTTEKEFAWALERTMREMGAEGMSFPPLVAAGEHAAVVHAKPTERKFNANEMVLIDFGLVWNGYCTDRTDTVAIGNPPEELKKIFYIVKSAHDYAIEAIKPGVKTTEIDKIAREYIANKGYGDYFTHGLGHGVGLEIHELPVFSPLAETVLEEGMILTVEPGIYIENLGGVRIEDMILVVADGVEVLTPPRPDDIPVFEP